MTRSPIFIVPATTPAEARHSNSVSPTATIAVWPTLSAASDFWLFTVASSRFFRLTSKRLSSCFSLPKYLTVS